MVAHTNFNFDTAEPISVSNMLDAMLNPDRMYFAQIALAEKAGMAQGIAGTIGSQTEEKRLARLDARRADRAGFISAIVMSESLGKATPFSAKILSNAGYLYNLWSQNMSERAKTAFNETHAIITDDSKSLSEKTEAVTDAATITAQEAPLDPKASNEEQIDDIIDATILGLLDIEAQKLRKTHSDLTPEEALQIVMQDEEISKNLEIIKKQIMSDPALLARIQDGLKNNESLNILEQNTINAESALSEFASSRMAQYATIVTAAAQDEEFDFKSLDGTKFYADAIKASEAEIELAQQVIIKFTELKDRAQTLRLEAEAVQKEIAENHTFALKAKSNAEIALQNLSEEMSKISQAAHPDGLMNNGQLQNWQINSGMPSYHYNPEQEANFWSEECRNAEQKLADAESELTRLEEQQISNNHQLAVLNYEISLLEPSAEKAETQLKAASLYKEVLELQQAYEQTLGEKFKNGEAQLDLAFLKKAILETPSELVTKIQELRELTGNEDFDPFGQLRTAAENLPPEQGAIIQKFIQEVINARVQAAQAQEGINQAVEQMEREAAMDPDGVGFRNDLGIGSVGGRHDIFSPTYSADQEYNYHRQQEIEAEKKLDELRQDAEGDAQDTSQTARFLGPEERAEASGKLTGEHTTVSNRTAPAQPTIPAHDDTYENTRINDQSSGLNT